jgi:hypothetical protein
MAATPLTVLDISRAGALKALTAANTDGHTIANTGKEFIEVANGAGAPITVTIAWGTGGTIDGVTPTARTITVTNATSKLIGPFPPSLYNDANGNVTITFSSVTTITCQALRVTPAI